MVYLRRCVEIPQSIAPGNSYFLVLREELLVTRCPGGSIFVTEYDIRRKLRARDRGQEFGEPLQLEPVQGSDGRYDLRVELQTVRNEARGRLRKTYHTLVALCLLQTDFDKKGKRLPEPRHVRQCFPFYQGDHKNWNHLDSRLRNLSLLPIQRHAGQGRDGWPNKSIPLKRKISMVKDIIDDPDAMRLRSRCHGV